MQEAAQQTGVTLPRGLPLIGQQALRVFQSLSGRDFDQLMVLIVLRSRELHDELGKRFPPKSIYRAMHPDLNGYWKFFGRIDVGEGFFFHAPVPKDTTLHDPSGRVYRLRATGTGG